MTVHPVIPPDLFNSASAPLKPLALCHAKAGIRAFLVYVAEKTGVDTRIRGHDAVVGLVAQTLALAAQQALTQIKKSFLLLFFKKEVLAFTEMLT